MFWCSWWTSSGCSTAAGLNYSCRGGAKPGTYGSMYISLYVWVPVWRLGRWHLFLPPVSLSLSLYPDPLRVSFSFFLSSLLRMCVYNSLTHLKCSLWEIIVPMESFFSLLRLLPLLLDLFLFQVYCIPLFSIYICVCMYIAMVTGIEIISVVYFCFLQKKKGKGREGGELDYFWHWRWWWRFRFEILHEIKSRVKI